MLFVSSNIEFKEAEVKGKDLGAEFIAFANSEEDAKVIERILMNTDILKEYGEEIVCSVGELLIFGEISQNILPQKGVSFVHYI